MAIKRYRCYFASETSPAEDQCFLYCRDDGAAWSTVFEELSRKPRYAYAEIWRGTHCIGLVWHPQRTAPLWDRPCAASKPSQGRPEPWHPIH